MEKKKKIKLVTFSPHTNFGTCLQSYALNTVLRHMGHDVEFIYNNRKYPQRSIVGEIKDILKDFLPQSTIESFWRWKRKSNMTKTNSTTVVHSEIHIAPFIAVLPNSPIKYVLSQLPFYETIRKRLRYRTTQWKKIYDFTFKDGNYKMKRLYVISQYEDIVDDADVFITGSDQIWNPYCYGFDPMMFLEFVKGRKKCIAYSSSIAQSQFPKEIEARVKKDLQEFEHIAVREQSSVELLNQLLERDDINLVIDPTYLLSKEEWLNFGKRAKIDFIVPEKYIFCYFIGNRTNDYIKMVEDVKEKTGINNVITIDCTNCNINYGNGILYKDGGPYEFIYLLSHASFICMDSFHATIFALKFEIEFTHIMKTDNEDSENSQNKRMYDLFDRYDLHYKEYNEHTDSWLKPIEWDRINGIVSKEIKKSLLYLENAI